MDRLRQLARRQGGLFTRSQAREYGYSAYRIRRRLATGEWRVVLGPVLTGQHVAVTSAVLDRAAALAVPASVLAGPSAARLLDIPALDAGTYLWIGTRQPRPLPGVRYLREPLSRREVILFEGVLITDRSRTVFDCLRLLGEHPAERLLDRALQAGWITRTELVGRVRAHAGHHGASRLVRLMGRAAGNAHSEAERRAISLLRGAGVTGWVANAPVPHTGAVGDLVFQAARLVVEIDGRAYHTTPERFERDRERQNRLVDAGWTVLRFTWRDLTERPEHVVATVQRLLDRAAAEKDRRLAGGTRSRLHYPPAKHRSPREVRST